MIKYITANGSTYSVGQLDPTIATLFALSGASKTNLTISSRKHLNFEPANNVGDIQFKPGDDISFYSHHRALDKQDEVSLKVLNGDDLPVKLQLNTSEILLTTKGKTGSNLKVMDVTVNSDTNTRGYLKVRAQAIDLRSESHGGIALQPKGYDSDGHMNKIKFEHGGGDGLEFGTFNTEHTSIFTEDYRFNKDGIWKMATRQSEPSDKIDASDPTTRYKYVKQEDDLYDVISPEDELADTESIIKTAHAFNYGKNRKCKFDAADNRIEIQTRKSYKWEPTTMPEDIGTLSGLITAENECWDVNKEYNEKDFVGSIYVTNGVYEFPGGVYYKWTELSSPNLNIESGKKLNLIASSDVVIETGSEDTDRLNISQCPNIYAEYKITKKGNLLGSDPKFISAVTNNLYGLSPETYDNTTDKSYKEIKNNMTREKFMEVIAGPETAETSCYLSDIIKLVNYMKTNHLGPWTI